VPPNLDRYERIAPLYDLLDLPFEYSRYRKIRPSSASTLAPPCWREQNVDAFRWELKSSCIRWTSPGSHSPISPLTRP
jgi:hypothetical protein